MQTIPWGQPGILPDPCRGSVLHRSEVYLTGVGTQSGPTLEGFLVIEKKKKKKNLEFRKHYNCMTTRLV